MIDLDAAEDLRRTARRLFWQAKRAENERALAKQGKAEIKKRKMETYMAGFGDGADAVIQEVLSLRNYLAHLAENRDGDLDKSFGDMLLAISICMDRIANNEPKART